jgi:hypothetical protein
MLPALTDDTRVDLRRPIFDVPSTPIPAAVMPDLEPDDELDDAATIQLSRLAWPEPPLSLAERPKLVRTDGGLTALTAARVNLLEQRPTFWRGLAIAVILAAGISIFVPRPHATTHAAAPTAPPRPTATAIAPPAAPMPPLFITVGTPPSANTVTAPPATKPAVPVTKLPTVRAPAPPPRPKATPAARPAPRPKTATPPAATRASASKGPAFSADTVVDDGF